MANTLVLLERITVGAAGAASVTFNSIPQTGYNDLKLVCSTRSNNAVNWLTLLVNGATTNVTGKAISGDGTSVASSNITAGGLLTPGESNTLTANTFSSNEFYFPNYTSSNNKSVSVDGVQENNASGAYSMFSALLWSNTAAITSVGIQGTSFNLVQYSTFSLYGVSNVSTTPTVAPKATGGDIIQTDGTYWYHAFINSGSFAPAVGLSCDLLVVAGGGGGGANMAGGGGAGGLLGFTSQSLASGTGYTCTVGAGGTGSVDNAVKGVSGNNSSFGALTTVVGGGGGGSFYPTAGASGGSGGGGCGGYNTGAGGTGGAGTSSQGNTGGAGASGGTGTYLGGGGGAGAGANGTAGSGTTGGAGGIGTNVYSSWLSATGLGVSGYIAGGGGGGTYSGTAGAGGSGGGGAGASSGGAAPSGITNTGGGGGGSTTSSSIAGGAGGSGIVIVRYAV
jgi:hypothetical protein